MRKLSALHYTIFMIAALAMLIALPSAHAATVNVDPLCDDGTIYPSIMMYWRVLG